MTKNQDKKANIHSADDLIVKMEAEKLGKTIPEMQKPQESQSELETPKSVEASESKEAESPVFEGTEEKTAETESPLNQSQSHEEPEDNAQDASSDEQVDEYGTKLDKPKLYTEDEVQMMIRKRLKNRHQENDTPEVQQAAKDFKADLESNESWETQLEDFIDKTIQKREAKRSQDEWQRQEQATQEEFETKFTSGMSKYKDFEEVVANKPITNAMMIATRSMNDPAAFIYAASKQHPKELERISQIKDPVHQATEIGRLEERMKKVRAIPQSPKPARKLTGDASSEMPKASIESRIAAHAKEKIMNRR